jgi:hypothetical protein
MPWKHCAVRLPRLIIMLMLAPAVLWACGEGGVPRPAKQDSMNEHANAYADLRARALDAWNLDLPSASAGHPDVVGVVIDIPSKDGYATVVALEDGATSLYTSVGGGVIGAGEHRRVASANARLLREAQAQLSEFTPEASIDHPGVGLVRLFVLTEDGRRVADIPEKQFWTVDSDRLGTVIAAAQAVITEMRQVGPG